MYRLILKRVFDILLSFIGIVILLPFFIIFTPIVAIKMKGNPFFVQERPGKNCKIFKMIKYRTMTNEKDEFGNLLSDDKRLTKFGKIMRKLSIDELPELFNIFIGQMSFVGPRPLLVEYLPRYNNKQLRRHEVKPGLTGLAQVNGRNALTWNEKFDLDIKYIEEITFLEDFKIICKTFLKVVKSDGISSNTSATMEVFEGENEDE